MLWCSRKLHPMRKPELRSLKPCTMASDGYGYVLQFVCVNPYQYFATRKTAKVPDVDRAPPPISRTCEATPQFCAHLVDCCLRNYSCGRLAPPVPSLPALAKKSLSPSFTDLCNKLYRSHWPASAHLRLHFTLALEDYISSLPNPNSVTQPSYRQ